LWIDIFVAKPDVLSEVMHFDPKVLGSWSHLWERRHLAATTVVFVNFAV